MKHLHKFASVLLALVMALSLMVPALAAETEGEVLPPTEQDGETTQETANIIVPTMENHTFVAYQIFNGTQAKSTEDDGPLADITWGSGINGDAFLTALKTSDKFGTENPFASATTPTEVAAALEGQEDNSAVAIAFANIAVEHTKGEGVTLNQGPGVKNGVPVGYYLIVDTTKDIGENDARNAVLLQLTKDVEVQVKVDVPKVEKKVEENREDAGFGDAADYAVGDKVPYKFTSAVPDMKQYETYKYEFHDKMAEGLDFNNDVVVTIGGKTIDIQYYEVLVADQEKKLTDDCTFEIKFADLKTIPDVKKGQEVVITFTATLNSKAVVGNAGNKNEVQLKFSNNPSESGDGDPAEGETPKDEVLVFTYELDTTKVDAQNPEMTLKDAEFHLSRVVKNEDGEDVTVWAVVNSDGKITDWVEAVDGNEGYVAEGAEENLNGMAYAGSTLKSNAEGLFVVKGLDNGTYNLLETKAPAGYNTPKDPFVVTITSTLSADGKKPEVESLTIQIGKDNPADGNKDTGIVNGIITNGKGATLPETGGIGTTIFYVVGGLLTVGAVVLLVTKKRMSVDSDK